MKKYGFFGGCFNPVTIAHIELALEIVNKYKLDKVIFVPMGDKYNKKGLINEKHRYNMLEIASHEYKELEVSNIELNQDKNLSTLEAFKKIENEYKKIDKHYIIGADNLYKMIKSEDFETLVKNYKYIIIERNTINVREIIESNEILIKNKDNFKIMKNLKHVNTSSTNVRKELLENETRSKGTVYEEVEEYIKKNNLYRMDNIVF